MSVPHDARPILSVMRSACLLFLFSLSTAALHGQTPAAEVPIKTTLCEIKKDPAAFHHKLVEFTATASHGFEDSMVEDIHCRWTDNNNPGVWLEYGGTAKTDTMYCCGPTIGTSRPKPLQIDGIDLPLIEDKQFEVFNARLHPPPKPRVSALVTASMVGRIFAAQEKINGRRLWSGYGHMGCCMLFVVTQVLSVDPTPPSDRLSLPSTPPPPPPRH
jgi:hypothetical protein